jgi:hypothetical protein
MTTFLYLDKSIPKESGANSRVIKNGAEWLSPDNLEIALIKEYSKYVKLTAIDPIVRKNSSENLFIGEVPFLIPNEKALSIFLVNGIGDGSYVEKGSIVYTDTAQENLLSFIVEIIQKNISHILKRITLAPNGVANNPPPRTTMPSYCTMPIIYSRA